MPAKVILLTGASKGIGRAIAERLGRGPEGHCLGLFARSAGALEEIAGGLGADRALVLTGDVTEEAAIQKAVAAVVERFGRIDVLINNAGIGLFKRADEFTRSEFEEVQRVNVTGPFLCTKYVLPHLIARKSGQVINISSVAGLNGFKSGTAYAASKFALNGFTESLREDVKQYGIAVTTVCPGSVATTFGGYDEETRRQSEYALEADDVARTVEYLVNESETANAKLIELKPRRRDRFRG